MNTTPAGNDLDGTPIFSAKLHNTFIGAREPSLLRVVTDISAPIRQTYLELKIIDKSSSTVRLYSDDGGETFYFDVDPESDFAQQVTALASVAEGLAEAVDTLTEDLSTAQTNITALFDYIDGPLDMFLTTVSGDIAALYGITDVLFADIIELISQLNDIILPAIEADLSQLIADVAALEAGGSLVQDYITLELEPYLAALEARVEELETRLDNASASAECVSGDIVITFDI